MSRERLTKYQANLLEFPEVKINILNPASLLPCELMTEHTCKHVIIQTYAQKPDLSDKPLLETEDEWFTDGISFLLNEERKAGYTVVSQEKSLNLSLCQLAGSSAQKVKLIVFTTALTVGKGKQT
jgi:hypothetical protein